MDYIDGESLNEIVRREGPMTEERAVKYIRQVGEALEYIHSRNMTHFDVKPANIMVRRSDDVPVLIDFGLSKQYDNKGDATSAMMNAASPGYSPIELYNPGSVTTFSPQTDVYSLGATLYYLLMGIVPPSALEIVETGLKLPTYMPSAIRQLIENSVQFNRAKRTESIPLFLENLSKVCKRTSDRNMAVPNLGDNKEDTKLLATDSDKENSVNTNTQTEIVGTEKKSTMNSLLAVLGFIGACLIIYSISNHSSAIAEDVEVDSAEVVEEVAVEEVQVDSAVVVVEDVAVVDSVEAPDTWRY